MSFGSADIVLPLLFSLQKSMIWLCRDLTVTSLASSQNESDFCHDIEAAP